MNSPEHDLIYMPTIVYDLPNCRLFSYCSACVSCIAGDPAGECAVLLNNNLGIRRTVNVGRRLATQSRLATRRNLNFCPEGVNIEVVVEEGEVVVKLEDEHGSTDVMSASFTSTN